MSLKTAALAAAILAGAAGTLLAQACPPEIQSACCNHGKDARPWKGMDGGVRWEWSLLKAKRRAAKEGKPILLYQLVGDLDKEGC